MAGSSSSFFDVSRAAHRRARIRGCLPTTAPAGFDQINDDIDALPDPDLLCAEERAAALAVTARLRNRLEAYLTGLAGAADVAGDSRVLGAGTTGTLVATATNAPVAVGSGMVNTAQQLHDLPVVAEAWAAGAISGLHVHQILAAAPHIDDFPAAEPAVVALAKLTDACEVRRVLQTVADAHNPTHLDLTDRAATRQTQPAAVRAGQRDVGDHRAARRGRRGDPGRNPGRVHPPAGHPRHHHPGPAPRRRPGRHGHRRGGQPPARWECPQ